MQGLTNLRRLVLQVCPLTSLPYSIKYLKAIRDVDLPQLILQGSANTLQCIMIQSCLNLVELPEWLQNLTSLQTLEILNCPMLSCLPEGVQRLTDLRKQLEDSRLSCSE
ncbi:hypothetical protein Pint_16958 [Pistacia integerrima]|uniref:Uncharacterized protein n=1 Tax=Pistacia integerrima TaxID=434235 RepID=A0ACC0ZA65_9ROSI|nr:hypothetical protein Pint_16958 [Pistacia integerrima]